MPEHDSFLVSIVVGSLAVLLLVGGTFIFLAHHDTVLDAASRSVPTAAVVSKDFYEGHDFAYNYSIFHLPYETQDQWRVTYRVATTEGDYTFTEDVPEAAYGRLHEGDTVRNPNYGGAAGLQVPAP